MRLLPQIVLESDRPREEPTQIWTQPMRPPQRIDIDLDVGDGVDGRVLRVGRAQAPGNYRVSVQFETSAAISGEGPHVDLVDWKHCRSEWRFAKQVTPSRFRLPVALERDHTCFPAATRAELKQALKQELDQSGFDPDSRRAWLESVERVPRVGESPSYVALSTVRVRIEEYAGGQWRLLTTIAFDIPMGC